MHKLVINLPNRHDRRAEMEEQLANVGWDAQFFAATRPSDSAGFPSVGARGCFLSHLNALKQARDLEADALLIMEDDLNFAEDFPQAWNEAYSTLVASPPWSIFYPGHTLKDLRKGLRKIPPIEPVQCTHFMLFNGSALAKLIDELQAILARPAGHPDGGPMHVDGAYSTIRARYPDLITYCWEPTLGYQRPSRTDVGEQRLFDSIRPLRPFAGVARKVKQRFRFDR